MKPDTYVLRKRILDDLGEAEVELESLEGEALSPAQRAHLRKTLDRVRKALCTTLVLGMESRA